ncbi:MAG: DUF6526 family protein [Candidatus Acidiferrum sp.]
MAEQNFKNHTKWVPTFHFFVLPILFINVGFSLYACGKAGFSVTGVLNVLVDVALLLGFMLVRMMATKVQDRVIRLEERVRFEKLLPPDLRARIGEFTMEQILALRFASDAELAEIARKVLDEQLNNRKMIKQMIKTWRPDLARA